VTRRRLAINYQLTTINEVLQQLINGLALGAIYALIALGYTMVYGVLRFINFAHGDVFMLGAFAGYFLSPLVNRILPAQSYLGGMLVLVLAMAVCAALGMLIEILAYRPLRNRPKLTVLITAIGVSLFIEYACQHRAVFGAAPRKFPDLPAVARVEVHRAKHKDRHRHARRVLQRTSRRAHGREHQFHHLVHVRPWLGPGGGGWNSVRHELRQY
jgi:branched-subunit amino acid ABC-type transport system permease component